MRTHAVVFLTEGVEPTLPLVGCWRRAARAKPIRRKSPSWFSQLSYFNAALSSVVFSGRGLLIRLQYRRLIKGKK
jgi:hypothetical protein